MSSIIRHSDKELSHHTKVTQATVKYELSKQNSSQRYIFHDVPKCGGISVVDSLANWFVILKDYPTDWSNEDNPPQYQEFCNNPYDLNKIKSHQLLAGHYHLENSLLGQRYPDWKNQGYKLFTFLRDPLEFQISLYHDELRMGRISIDDSIRDRLLLRKNFIANLMKCNDSNYLNVLRQYFFIGIIENYQDSFDRLSLLTGRPYITLKKYNESSRRSFDISEELIRDFKEANQLDYKIYDYASSFYDQDELSVLPQGLFV